MLILLQLVGLGGLMLISGFVGFNAGALGRISGQGHLMGKTVQNTGTSIPQLMENTLIGFKNLCNYGKSSNERVVM